MNRRRAGAALLALLAVLAFAAAAATLDATSSGSGPSGGGGSGQPASDSGGSPPVPDLPVSELLHLLYFLLLSGVVVAGLAGIYALYREYGVRGPASVILGVAGLVALTYLALRFANFDPASPPPGPAGPEELPSPANDSGLGDEPSEGVPTASPPVVLALGVALALLAGGLVLVRATGGADYAPPADVRAGAADAEPLGRVAGRAADRIDRGAVVDNEVYRAWREMIDHLDVDHPDATTPAEFAAAAVDAGVDPEDADELTRLFAEVRYGGGDVTAEREERAVAALRRIEEEHA